MNLYFGIFLALAFISGSFTSLFPSNSFNAYAEDSKMFPPWVRIVFTYWANGDITDEDLKGALEFLLANKIIDLEKKKTKSVITTNPNVGSTLSNLHDSQKSNITINDNNFFSVA